MSYYLIGIGGTGAKCMESFVHLCGAGLLKDSQPVKIVYVDADISCGNLQRTQRTVDLYTKAQKIGYSDNGIFKNHIDVFEPWTPVPQGSSNLDDVFQRSVMENKEDYKALGLLYNSLYTEQERKTPLDKGFRGHPAIGAAVMSYSMQEETGEPWISLKQQINSDKDAKVFLFASVFGGTGAAGFPTIAKILDKTLKKDDKKQSVAKIGGALVLPYFQFPPAPNTEEQEMQAKVSEFMLNTRSALDYYNKSGLLGNIFKSIYLIGDNDLSQMKEFSLGANTQKNAAHFIEIYAALAAFDFFNKNESDFEEEQATTPMIARGDDNNTNVDKVEWEDLPNVCVSGNLKDRVSIYTKFLYAYKQCIFKVLQECSEKENKKRDHSWYKDLVEKAGKIDVYNDRSVMSSFQALEDYAAAYFDWWRQIIHENNNRRIELLSNDIWSKVSWQDSSSDMHAIILPVQERNKKDRLTYKNFYQGLCTMSERLKSTSASGSEILMDTVYKLCSDRGEDK